MGHRVSWCVLWLSIAPAFAGESRAADERLLDPWRWARFGTESGLGSQKATSLIEASDGTVWANTSEGVHWFDGFRWRAVSNTPRHPATLYPGEDGVVHAISRGKAWRGTKADGFSAASTAWDGATKLSTMLPLDDGRFVLASRNSLWIAPSTDATPEALALPTLEPAPANTGWGTSLPIDSLAQTESGRFWVLSPRGAFEWDGTGWHHRFPHRADCLWREGDVTWFCVSDPMHRGFWSIGPGDTPRRAAYGATNIVEAMSVHPQSRNVVAITMQGGCIVRRDGKWHSYNALPQSMAASIASVWTSNDELWIATDRGLYLCSLGPQRWETIGEPTEVNAILPVDDEIWITTGDGVRLHRGGMPGRAARATSEGRLGIVTGIARDHTGAIWLSSGAAFGGAMRLTEAGWERLGADQGLHDNPIHRIHTDDDGTLWFLPLTWPDEQRSPIYTFNEGGLRVWEPSRGLDAWRVYDMAEGPDGARWFATVRGIVCHHPTSGWQVRGTGLRHVRVFTIEVDDDGIVWFGHQHNGCGLGRLEPESDVVEYFGAADGLQDEHVWEVASGADGALWIATSNGLALRRDGHFTDLGPQSGLAHPRVWPVVPSGDRVYVGSLTGGLHVLHLDEFNDPAPTVEMGELVQHGDGVLARWNVYPYRGSGGDFKPETRYRLDGGEWSHWSRHHETFQVGLDSGDHYIDVQAKGLYGQVTTKTASAVFQIDPPWYRRPLFVGGLALWLATMIGLGVAFMTRSSRDHRRIREREERFRLLVQHAPIAIGHLAPSGRLASANAAMQRLLGVTDEADAVGHSLADDAAIPAERDAVRKITVEGGSGETTETEYVSKCGRIIALHVVPISAARRKQMVIATDVTHRRRTERRQRLMMDELDHRVKNNLAAVLALAEGMTTNTDSIEQFRDSFTGRIRAMARTHDALARERWDGIDLAETVRLTLDAYMDAGQVTIEGKTTRLPPRAAPPLGLALHELATNAIKYGSLSTGHGRLNVSWTTDDTTTKIKWVETGGPDSATVEERPVVTSSGMGLNLVRGLVEYELGGKVSHRVSDEGVICELELPMEA